MQPRWPARTADGLGGPGRHVRVGAVAELAAAALGGRHLAGRLHAAAHLELSRLFGGRGRGWGIIDRPRQPDGKCSPSSRHGGAADGAQCLHSLCPASAASRRFPAPAPTSVLWLSTLYGESSCAPPSNSTCCASRCRICSNASCGGGACIAPSDAQARSRATGTQSGSGDGAVVRGGTVAPALSPSRHAPLLAPAAARACRPQRRSA